MIATYGFQEPGTRTLVTLEAVTVNQLRLAQAIMAVDQEQEPSVDEVIREALARLYGFPDTLEAA